MSDNDFWMDIDRRFPGLERVFSIGHDGVKMFLSGLLHPESSAENFTRFENQFPKLFEYLTFDDPNRHTSPGPTRQVYQALSDLMKLVADLEWDAE